MATTNAVLLTTGACLVVWLAIFTSDTRAEGIFFHRDHHNQGFYAHNTPKFEGVTNYEQLVSYLNKYGYINCTYKRTLTKRSVNIPFEELDELDKAQSDSSAGRVACRRTEVLEALKKVQKKLGLEPSGVLDGETKTILSTVRCGNKDSDKSIGRIADDDDDEEEEDEDDVRDDGDSDNDGDHDVGGDDGDAKNSTTPAHSTRKVRRAVEIIAEARHARRLNETTLYRRLAGAASKTRVNVTCKSRLRRERLLQEIIARIRSENATRTAAANATSEPSLRPPVPKRLRGRRRRSMPVSGPGNVETHIAKFKRGSKTPIRWRLIHAGYSRRLTVESQLGMLELAFRMWSEVIPPRFVRQDHGSIDNIDVLIAFGKGQHLNCNRSFDGSGGELAHSRVGIDMHFDDDEDYKVRDYVAGIYFVRVAVHEIGHVLGLAHNNKRDSIMFPIYQSSFGDELELGHYDRKAMQQIYGVCRGTFDLVFDWLRKKPRDPAAVNDNRPTTYIFNTYFFRHDHYWMYENRARRPRYGDPLRIANEWRGVPDHVDGYMQILFRVGALYEYEIKTYFFRRDEYYLYDDARDQVVDGWPRLIAEDFGPKPNSTETVPNNLDAVYYDRRDNLIYFFKGEWVWLFDPELIGQGGCCERKVLFKDLFPMEEASNSTTLTGNINQVFYSYAHHMLYVFHAETVYENVGYNNQNSLRKTTKWYHKWHDICDVE